MNIKNIKCCLLLVGLLFTFTSCVIEDTPKAETGAVANNTEKNMQDKDIDSNTVGSASETTALTGNATAQTEAVVVENTNQNSNYGFFNSVSNSYKEYINSLRYLDEIEAEIPLATTTFDMVKTRGNAFNAWDKELNKIYTLLLEKLSAEDIEELKTNERLWIQEKEKTADYLKSMGGSQASVDANDFLFTETKQRTFELIHMYFSHDHDKTAAMEAYSAVVQNKAKFFSESDNRDVYLEEYFEELYETMYLEPDFQFEDILSRLYFSIVDLNEDDVPEIILSMKSYGDYMVVLHYEDGTVYGYGFFGVREMGGIKKDGSFHWSGGNGYRGYSKIQLFGVTYKWIGLASLNGNKFDENGVYLETNFLVNNVPATEEEFYIFDEEQERKEDVIWRPFSENDNSNILNIYAEREPHSDIKEVMEAFKAVLQNESKLYSIDEEKYVYFKESGYVSDISHKDPLSMIEFSVVDMDGDGTAEVVLTANDSIRDVTEVLHFDNGTVYSYGFGLRHMYYIKTDGSYCWTAGAQNSGYSKLRFLGMNYKQIELESNEDKYDEKGNYLETIFLINGVPATEAEDSLFIEQQNRKEDAIWYDLNEENISLQITVK